MSKRLNNYLRSLNILIKSEYDIQEKSKKEVILEFMDYAYDIISLFAVYIDLSKVFDIVNHNMILRKLQHIGI